MALYLCVLSVAGRARIMILSSLLLFLVALSSSVWLLGVVGYAITHKINKKNILIIKTSHSWGSLLLVFL